MLDARVKKMFFDRKAVTDGVDRAERRVMARFGGLVRTIARRSMKPAGKKGKASEPGQPPRTRTRLLKDNIFFAYDRLKQSVVIGPRKLNRRTEVPKLLEEGGGVVTRRPRLIPAAKTGRDAQGRFTKGDLVRVPTGTTLKYEERPYMGPAFQQAKPKLDDFWANSVR